MITTIRRISLVLILIALLFVYLPNRIIEVITLLAVIIALFRDKLYYFFFSPNLVITASSGPSHFGVAPVIDSQTGQIIDYPAYFGVIVENNGIGIAKNVELLFNGLKSNRIPDFVRFKSIPLIRSWIHNPIVDYLHNSIPIRFDICFISGTTPNILNFVFLRTPTELININCIEHKDSFFEFEVVALSNNAPLARRRVRITYNDNYVDGFDVTQP